MYVSVYEHVCLCVYACFKYTELSTVILMHHKYPSYPAILKKRLLFYGIFHSQLLHVTEEPNNTRPLNNGKWKSLYLDAG